jgi:glycosyltransferase involved in cell wall biosynthesis
MVNAVSALIPVYNEAQTLPLVIEELLRITQINEIIIVDDGSTDGTKEFLQTYSHPKVKIHLHAKNQGKTAAINTAIQNATGPIVLIQDADLEYDPQDIPNLLEPILKGRADVVYGSRFLVKNTTRVLYYYHFLANKLLTFLSNVLTNMNMTDIETGYKVFPLDMIKPLGFTSKGFGMEIEITAIMGKIKPRLYEVPISYYGRTYDEGKKIGFSDGVAAILYIFYYNLLYVHTSKVKSHILQQKAKYHRTSLPKT